MCSKYFLILSALLLMCAAVIQAKPADSMAKPKVKQGHYIPELYGGLLGRYVPDDSGRYRHVHQPYDGGYGDRGVRYVNDLRGRIFQQEQSDRNSGPPPALFALGPEDHLRFTIDFNYNGSGWQIINFEWTRDDNTVNYRYVHETELWHNDGGATESPTAYEYDTEAPEFAQQQEQELEDNKEPAEQPPETELDTSTDNATTERPDETEGKITQQVHVAGEYDADSHHVNYSKAPGSLQDDAKRVHATINEVLEYIQNSVLPTLP